MIVGWKGQKCSVFESVRILIFPAGTAAEQAPISLLFNKSVPE